MFSRIVTLGDQQILRADVFDNTSGRTLALASVQADSFTQLTRQVPSLVDELIREANGALPLRVERSDESDEVPSRYAYLINNGLLLTGIGGGAFAVAATSWYFSAARSNAISLAADAYTADPSLDNARAVVAARGGVDDDLLTQCTIGGACISLVSGIALLSGLGVTTWGLINASEEEDAP